MTATSAHSANGTLSSTTNPFLRDLVASLRTVQLPGTSATYANRVYLRDLGLRWDPANRRWHGTTTADRVRELREKLGLVVKCFGDLEAPPKGPAAPRPPAPSAAPIAMPARNPTRRLHDGSRTRVEARVAFPEPGEGPDEIGTPTRRFTVMETTSGLPDDSREEEERQEERRLRDLRGRVKAARAVVTSTPGLAETLASDWRMAARFYARFGVTEVMFRRGVPGTVTSLQGADPALAEQTSPEPLLLLGFGLSPGSLSNDLDVGVSSHVSDAIGDLR